MLECHELALQACCGGRVGGSSRVDRSGKVDALKEDLGDAFYAINQDFRGVYYKLRSLLVDKTMQGIGGLYNEERRLDRITPLVQAMCKGTLSMISNQPPVAAKDSKVIQSLVDPSNASSSVSDRLKVLLNPAYFPEPDRSDRKNLYNRWGMFCGLAGNLKQGSPEGDVLQGLLGSNFSFLKAEMPGLDTGSLGSYWKK
jgi:hypothetical protein